MVVEEAGGISGARAIAVEVGDWVHGGLMDG